jgi:hypothetical protein
VEAEEGEDLWKSVIIFELIRRGQHQFVVEDKLVHYVYIIRFWVDAMCFIENQAVYF